MTRETRLAHEVLSAVNELALDDRLDLMPGERRGGYRGNADAWARSNMGRVARMAFDGCGPERPAPWDGVLLEQVYKALAEASADPAKLRAELVQVAAVAESWVLAIDRREARP